MFLTDDLHFKAFLTDTSLSQSHAPGLQPLTSYQTAVPLYISPIQDVGL